LKANILISPNFGINSRGVWLLKWSFSRWLVKRLLGEYRGFEPQNEFHAKYWTERYPIDALLPMLDLLDELDDLDKSKIRTPQMIVYSPSDKVINVGKALQTAQDQLTLRNTY